MRKTTATYFMSLDGVVEAPENWHPPYFSQELGAALGAGLAQGDGVEHALDRGPHRRLPAALLGPSLNVYRACLHPDGLAGRIVNFGDWAGYLLGQLRRSIALTGDPGLRAIAEEVRSYPNVANIAHESAMDDEDLTVLLVPLRLRSGEAQLSLFTTLTTFGTARDITLEELAVELFLPADGATEELLRDTSRHHAVAAEAEVTTLSRPGKSA